MSQRSDVVVRQADVDDVAVVSAIGQESFRAAYENTCEPDDLVLHLDELHSEAAVLEQMDTPGSVYLLAENDGQPAGFAKVRDSASLPQISASNVIELHQLYVLSAQQRFGIGGFLIKAVLDCVRDKAAEGVWLSAWEEATWAVNFYRKHGFETVGTTEFRLGKTVYADLLMWRPADPIT